MPHLEQAGPVMNIKFRFHNVEKAHLSNFVFRHRPISSTGGAKAHLMASHVKNRIKFYDLSPITLYIRERYWTRSSVDMRT